MLLLTVTFDLNEIMFLLITPSKATASTTNVYFISLSSKLLLMLYLIVLLILQSIIQVEKDYLIQNLKVFRFESKEVFKRFSES